MTQDHFFSKNIAHLEPLSPLSYLERSSMVYGDRLAAVDDTQVTYRELMQRAERLAGAIRERDIGQRDRVAYLSPNTHALLEGHFGVPASGAVLVAMNTRLSPSELGEILRHSEAKALVYDRSLADQAQLAANNSGVEPLLIESGSPSSEYERMIENASTVWEKPGLETDPISINYTSGTTGNPKGVVYHHRGAYLQALAMAYHARLHTNSVYLWTLPMFHTNGWCFPWAVTAAGARHRCLPVVDPAEIWKAIRTEGVTHLCAAPTVLLMLADHPDAGRGAPLPLSVMTGGAPPTPTLLERLSSLNIDVVHLYGLTETFGPAAICDWHPEWSDLSTAEQAQLKARQGVGNVISAEVRVVDSNGDDVANDGQALGEIVTTGNNLMAGYYRDPKATSEAIRDGWFHTGDLAVRHPDGYIEIRDRKKDVIISGGENISSVEVERVLARHPAVLEAAVIGTPHEIWGEVPVAIVELRQGVAATPEELMTHVRRELAGFKAPKAIFFESLPRTSTGKIMKHVLRSRQWSHE